MESFACPSTWMAAILSPDTLITSLSSGAEQFTGYSAQELVGRSITQILTDSSVFEMPHIMNAARECGYWEGEIILRARKLRSWIPPDIKPEQISDFG
jgi:PAS domain S-box-containing protein